MYREFTMLLIRFTHDLGVYEDYFLLVLFVLL